jgi:hypothetical protein
LDRQTDRFTLWVLRAIASATTFAGVSVLVAAIPTFGLLPDAPAVQAIALILLQLSGVFLVAGLASAFLARRRGWQFPNERATGSGASRPGIGGWVIALAIALIALPAWLLFRLQPFLAEWKRVFDLLVASDILQGANANMSGVVLLPLAGALTPPFFELAALSACVGGSVVLLALLLSRSPRFPRIYVVCSVLLTALVIASVRGADAAMLAAEAIERLIAESDGSAAEAAQLREGLERYTRSVGSTAPVLAWALAGYLAWIPALLLSERARVTFAADTRPGDSLASSPDLEAITSTRHISD